MNIIIRTLFKRQMYLALLNACANWGTLDARGPLVRQRRGPSERVVLVGERPLAQAVKSFERADPIGHFRITSGLVFEASLGAHPFICKSIFIHTQIKLIFM